jgi:hypothetical protein
VKRTRGPRVGSKQKKRINTASDKTGNGALEDIVIDQQKKQREGTILDKVLLDKLLDKYPTFNPEWPEDVQLKWFEGWDKLTGRIKK